METKPTPSTHLGTPGLDVFKIAGRSISGFLPSFKTGDPHRVRLPFTTHLEERLAMYLEYCPHVRSYQRGDASEACAKAYDLAVPLGTPYRINYVFDGKQREYLPDYVGTLCDGGFLIAEAGREEEKSVGRALAKAEAARRLAQIKRGEYWIGTDLNLIERRHQNWLYLHARRQPFPAFAEIATALLGQWPYGQMQSVSEWVRRFGPHWSDAEVEATIWKLAGDAAAEGRLLVDLCEGELSHETPLALLSPEIPSLLPDPLPNALEESREDTSADDEDIALDQLISIPGPTFDASVLRTAAQQKLFHRNLAAVTAVLTGTRVGQVAHVYGMGVSTLSRLVRRTKQFGQMACVPYGTYHRDRILHPELQQLIRTLYTQPHRPTAMAIYEDVQLKHMADALSEREHKEIAPPTYRQVQHFIKQITSEPTVMDARSGFKHLPHERTSASSFVLSIASPGG